jgi:hypothetical protein
VQIGLNDGGRSLVYRRRLVVGRDKQILIRAEGYPVVKQFFDAVDRSDAHSLALRKPGGQ